MTSAPLTPSLWEGLRTTPSRRYLSSDPLPDDLIWELLDTAVRGPSGGNRQGWGWLVVTDPEVKAPIADWYREGWVRAYGRKKPDQDPESGFGVTAAGLAAVEHLASHLEEAPVWVIPFLRNAADSTDPRLGSSIYGAVQQLILAARAHGLGTTLTSFHTFRETEVRRRLGLPDDALTMALIPIGRPVKGSWHTPRRRPVEEVVHWNSFDRFRDRPATAVVSEAEPAAV